MAKILVYGWYGHNNVGDELMSEALRKIFPAHNLQFVDIIRNDALAETDLVIIGGGSFLSFPLTIDKLASKSIFDKPIVYAGIGAETDVHQDHIPHLQRACGVFIRSLPSKQFATIRPDAEQIPDLSLTFVDDIANVNKRQDKLLLVLPNAEVVPDISSPNWKHVAWNYYKSECAQALDVLIDNGWNILMAPLCADVFKRDSWAAAELAAQCLKRNKIQILSDDWFKDASFEHIRIPFERAAVVLTQRFHGAPISQITSTPCVAIHHHDKLANISPNIAKLIPYYGARKDLIISAVLSAKTPIICERNKLFSQIQQVVEKALVKL